MTNFIVKCGFQSFRIISWDISRLWFQKYTYLKKTITKGILNSIWGAENTVILCTSVILNVDGIVKKAQPPPPPQCYAGKKHKTRNECKNTIQIIHHKYSESPRKGRKIKKYDHKRREANGDTKTDCTEPGSNLPPRKSSRKSRYL